MGMPVATKAEGICFAFPDICLIRPTRSSPVVPVPYPNIGGLGQAVMVSTKVKINGKPVILQGSQIPMSSGDPNSLGGVFSGKIMGKVAFITSSQRVKIEGRGVVRLGDITTHNDSNAMGAVIYGSPRVKGG